MIPNAPEFLLTKGSQIGALKAYIWYNGSADGFEEYKKSILSNDQQDIAPAVEKASFKSLIKTPVARKPFLISLGLFGFQQLCGLTFVYYYLEEIFIYADTKLDPGTSAAAIGLAQVGQSIIAFHVHLFENG